MSTFARTNRSESSHWYWPDSRPCYEVPYADQSKGMRPTTLRDARKLGLLPSVTTILRILHRQALVEWLQEQAVLAAMTTPRLDGEELDAFIHRVLSVERQQDQEAQKARDLGTAIHSEIEAVLTGKEPELALAGFVEPAVAVIRGLGAVQATEKIVVGEGYAGKLDVLTDGDRLTVLDIKTSKTIPRDGSYVEHRLQTAAYAMALGNTGDKCLETANLYISTLEPGKLMLCQQDNWVSTYNDGFAPLVRYWQWVNNYTG